MQPTSLAVTPTAPGADAPDAPAAPAFTLAGYTRSVRCTARFLDVGVGMSVAARRSASLVACAALLAAVAGIPQAVGAPRVLVPGPVSELLEASFDTSLVSVRPWERENRESGISADENAARRLLSCIGRLGERRLPADEDSLIVWLDPCFPDSFTRSPHGEWRLNWTLEASRLRLLHADFDGIDPEDYALYVEACDGRRYYALLTVVRSPSLVSYQSFGGSMWGAYGMLERAGAVSDTSVVARAADCGWFVHVSDLDSDGRDDLLIHDEVGWYVGATPCKVDTMRGYSCDLPVPYFWDGERLSFDLDRAAQYYEGIMECSGFPAEPDMEALRCPIARVLSAAAECLDGGLAPN